MLIKFHEDFIKYTSFQSTIQVSGKTVREVLQKLLNDYPQLYVFLLANEGEEADKTSFKLNDEYLVDVFSLNTEVGNTDILEIGRDVPEGESSVGRIIAGAVIAIGGGYLTGWNPYVVGFGVSLMLGGAAELIAGSPMLPTFDSGSSTSATYTFSGIKNTTVLGTPISGVWGTCRIGGHIVNAYNDVIGTDEIGNTSWLRMQIGLCEGEINRIDPASVEINNRNIKTFPTSDIGVICRYGTKLQSPPESPLVTAVGATSKVIPSKRTFNFYGSAYTEESLAAMETEIEYELPAVASGVDIQMRAYWKTYSDKSPNIFYVYWKEKNETQYGNSIGPVSMPEDNRDGNVLRTPKVVSIVFPSTATYVIKVVVPRYTIDGNTTGAPMPILGSNRAFDTEGVPQLPYGATGALDLYIDELTLHNSGEFNTDTKAPMEFFNHIENSTTHSLPINNDPSGIVTTNSPGTVVTTSGIVDKLKVNLSAPVLYRSSGGDLLETSVEVKIYWKLNSEQSYLEDNSVTAVIKGKTKSEVELSKDIPITISGIYDVKAVRVTPYDADDLLKADRVYLKDLVEIVAEELIYPHTALLGLSIKATDHISGGLPTVTCVVQGIKVKVPENYNGALREMEGPFTGSLSATKAWTDNPVWCLYDLLTNERYGLKNYFKISPTKIGLMLSNFYTMAQYCDARVLEDGTVVTKDDIHYNNARPRFSLNIVIDQSKSAIEWLNIICASMRATLFYAEGMIYLDIDRPKPITQIFNMSNITDYTESGMSLRSIPNVYEVQFNNRDKDYDQDTMILEDPTYQQDLTLEENKKTLQLMGVTDEKQAKSIAKYTLRTSQLLTSTVSFKTSTYGLLSSVGDVIGIQHDVPQWGFGGTVKAYDSATKVITLSEAVTIETGKTYSIRLVSKGGTPELVGITEPVAGEYTQLTLESNPTVLPEDGDYFTLGEVGKDVKPFKIVAIKRDKDEVIEVSCVEYNEQIYTDADDITDLPVIVPNDYRRIDTEPTRSVRNVTVESAPYVDSSGIIKIGATVYYTVPTDNLAWAGVVVYYGTNGIYSETPVNRTGTVFIPDITVAGSYRFICASMFTNGTRQTINEVLEDTENSPFADITISLELPNVEFTNTGVTNLRTLDGVNGSYYGRSCNVAWDAPVFSDLSGVLIEQNLDNAAATNRSLLHYYKVLVKNTNGTTRREARVYEERYAYSYELNREDGSPTRTFDITVTAIDKLGRESAAATLRCSNPVPAAIT